MRLAQLSEHEQIKSLRDEIALARMLIEERFNKGLLGSGQWGHRPVGSQASGVRPVLDIRHCVWGALALECLHGTSTENRVPRRLVSRDFPRE